MRITRRFELHIRFEPRLHTTSIELHRAQPRGGALERHLYDRRSLKVPMGDLELTVVCVPVREAGARRAILRERLDKRASRRHALALALDSGRRKADATSSLQLEGQVTVKEARP